MQDAATFYWMLGVMGIMVAYGICSVIGVIKSKKQ